MKAGWELKTLGELFDIGSSKRVLKSEWTNQGVPFFRAREIVKLAKNGFVENDLFISEAHYQNLVSKYGGPKAGDLMVSAVGTLGKCYEVKAEDKFYYKDASVICFHPKVEIISKFIEYAFQTQEIHGQVAAGEGATVGTFTIHRAKNTKLRLPPLEEQKRIVSILDEAFEGLDRARENAEANLKSARELFSEAVRLNLKERDNWVTATLSKCFRLKSGDNLTSKSMVTGPFEVYGGNGVAGKHNASNLSGDNVIVGRVGALCGRARCISKDIWLTDNAFKVVDYNYDFDPRFLARLLNFLNLGSLARQAAQPVISNSSLKDLILKFPKERTEQTAIADNLDKYEFKIDTARSHYRTKLQDISDLRQSLLQKAFAGELT